MAEQVDDAGVIHPRKPLLVGRERERALLCRQLDAMLAGHGSLVLVGGEAGIGKTTLVEDLAAQAEGAGCLVIWGHAYDLTVTPPYGPWVELARGYTPTSDLPPFPAFLHDGEALAAVGSQEALFAQTWDFFAAVATIRPVVLVLEDLHWVDQESLALLRFVARQVARHRVLLLATYRSDELTRRHSLYQQIPLLVREAGAARLDVRPLDEVATRGLITGRYDLPGSDVERLEAYLAEHAEGNPLYAGELLRTLEDDG
ncbi:MAG TPA: ATP-binding protein, partial [Thermomicrobiaceae bacterium]|nr:ATP-binding protein [Thermomicrobiaceae bacterium]